ncbi:class D sortase [Povalibacter sp.]|uniref:class D sortase n=1 Tax=Povalibacter sp. TaxID=1962978 RepID=UPI002F3EA2F5
MRPVRLLEISAWIAGALLLAAYIGFRTWSANASADGVDAMRQARAQHAALLVQNTTEDFTPASPRAQSLQTGQPDTSLWNAKRLAQYRTALQHQGLPEAVLRVPKLKLEVPVYEGTSDLTLNRGAGRIAGTAAIDSATGNIGIAAHRDGFFRVLKDIRVGDTLFLDTVASTREYRITRLDIVDPGASSVLAPTETAQITLVTCYPFYFVGSAPQRFIVHAQATPLAAGG